MSGIGTVVQLPFVTAALTHTQFRLSCHCERSVAISSPVQWSLRLRVRRVAALFAMTNRFRVLLSGAPGGRRPISRRTAIRKVQLDRTVKERCHAGD